MNTTIKQINDHIYAIDQEMVRCFVVLGSKEALILDAGVAPFDLAGCVSGLTDLPVKLCLTHSDRDHIANIQQFSTVYLHQDEIPYLKTEKPLECVAVKEGDCFDLGDRVLEVIHAPGHTPGSICLLDRAHHEFFSGDTVSLGPVYMFGGHRDLTAYLKTLRRLNEMDGNQDWVIYPAHNLCPIKADVITGLIQCAERIQDHTIEGQPTKLAGPDGYSPLLYSYQNGNIYW